MVRSDKKPGKKNGLFAISCSFHKTHQSCSLHGVTTCLIHQNKEAVNCLTLAFTAALCCRHTFTPLFFNGPSALAGFHVAWLKCRIKSGLLFIFSLRNVTVRQSRRFRPWVLEQLQSSITDCRPLGDCFPSFCSVVLISVLCFSVYVYRRLKGLFVSPPSCSLTRFLHKRVWNIVIFGQTPFSQRVIESCQLVVPRVSNASCRKISHCFRMTSGIY